MLTENLSTIWPSGLDKWAGRCNEAVELMLSAPGIDGVRCDGFWTGKVTTRWRFPKYQNWQQSKEGFPIHVWIQCRNGSIIDPTRWVFEGVWPYIYRGPADFYKIGDY